MRKLLSLILAWSLVLALCLPVSAATTGKLVTVTKDNFAAYQTDDEVVMMAWDDLGTVALSAKYLNDPETIYQWIGTAEEIPASLTGQTLAAAFSVADVARLQATEVFEVAVQTVEEMQRAGSDAIKAQIREQMIDLYGTLVEGWPVSVDRTSYIPLVIGVLETDSINVVYDFNVEIEVGMTLLSLVSALCTPVVGYQQALDLVTSLWDGFDMTYQIATEGYISTYTGNYLTHRTAYVTPPQENTVYLNSASKTIRQVFWMQSMCGEEVLVRDATPDVLYINSELEFQIQNMIDIAYRLYIN